MEAQWLMVRALVFGSSSLGSSSGGEHCVVFLMDWHSIGERGGGVEILLATSCY